MDRLTRKGQDFENDFCLGCDCGYYGEPYGCNSPDGECESYRYFTQLADRLAEYEDTGLSPAEVAELAQAKADGRVVVLPCKVGDAVWKIKSAFSYFTKPMEDRVERIIIYKNEILVCCTSGAKFSIGSVGKAVFLSREEAEKALEVGKP